MPEPISDIMPRRGGETFLLAASVPNQQKDYILQKRRHYKSVSLSTFLNGLCAPACKPGCENILHR
ncbi:unnamed protein product, partial [Ixodes persulcatus]